VGTYVSGRGKKTKAIDGAKKMAYITSGHVKNQGETSREATES